MAVVTIEQHDGRYRLRWLYQGKRYTMACGVPATPTGKAIAKQKAAEIEKDITAGYFDPTLLKYRPRTLGKTATEVSASELFRRYAEAMNKDKALSRGGFEKYRATLAHLKRFLGNSGADSVNARTASNFVAQLLEQVSNQTAKQYLWLLQSCWEWARGRYHVAEPNPWSGLAAKIKPQPQQRVKPFTQAEVKAIIGAFRSSQHYAHYSDLVTFLFGTACRFGEVAGLKWEHVAPDFQTAWIGESVSRGHRKATKTGKARTVILSPSISEMLRSRQERLNPQPDALVFPSLQGLPIDDHNFRNRAWKTILEQCHIEYRKPYSTRHTAVSHALANGANYIQVAQASGHDPKVMHQHYAHVIERQSVFTEF